MIDNGGIPGDWRPYEPSCHKCYQAKSNCKCELQTKLARLEKAYGVLKDVCEYAVGPTRDVKTPRLREALTKAEAILGGKNDA